MSVSEPIVKDLLVKAPIDGITTLEADGIGVYFGNDPIIISAWKRLAFEGMTFQQLLLSAMRESPLLQCIDCRNTESPAGAMARQFNHGRCVHCGGYFKVVRA